MELLWRKHYLYPEDLSHAHHNGYSILRADTEQGEFHLGGAKYEVYPAPSPFDLEDEIARFDTEEETLDAIK